MSLHSYPTINPFEQMLLSRDWENSRHVLAVRTGNGLFGKALRKTLPTGARLVCADSREGLTYEDGVPPSCGEWSIDELQREVEEYGPFDTLIFSHFQEYFGGRIGSLARMLELLDENGRAWFQFTNGANLENFDRRVRLGGTRGSSLSHPMYHHAPLDLASMIGWANSVDFVCEQVWGYLPQELFEWVTRGAKGERRIDLLRKGISVRNAYEAVMLGSQVVGMAIRPRQLEDPANFRPSVSAAPVTAYGLQTFLLSLPERSEAEATLWQAKVEIKAWQAGVEPTVSEERAELLSGFLNDPKVRRVLLVGGADGGDWLLFSRRYDNWQWSAVDHDAVAVAEWQKAFPGEGQTLQAWDPSTPFPFADKSFDLVVSMGAMGRVNPGVAMRYVEEMLRVSAEHVVHLEDYFGPGKDIFRKNTPLPLLYQKIKIKVDPRPVLVNGKESGLATVFIEKKQAVASDAPAADRQN